MERGDGQSCVSGCNCCVFSLVESEFLCQDFFSNLIPYRRVSERGMASKIGSPSVRKGLPVRRTWQSDAF